LYTKNKNFIFSGTKSPHEEFTAYCYPANIGGNAFGFNSSGFAFGINTLYSTKVVGNKIRNIK